MTRNKEVLRQIDQTLADLHRTQKLLNSARRFGFFDLFDGKDHGLFFSFLKRRRLNQANEKMRVIKEELDDLQVALGDRALSKAMKPIQVSWLWDMWLDNMISDWYSQRKVKKSLKAVKDLQKQLKKARADVAKNA
ncbi:MAG: hypothetical protein Q4A67_01465 [Aerococcus sp.]|nr:hypothetical protein [Aerococcus sp.]